MAAVVARVLTGLATATVLAGVVVGWAGHAPASALASLAGLLAVAAGWVVVGHDPRSPVGPALAWSAAAIALVVTNDVLAASAYGKDPLPLAALARPVWVGLWPVNLAGILALLLVFPDGRGRGRLWSSVPWLFAAGVAGTVVSQWDKRQVGGEVVGEESPYRTVLGLAAIPLIGVCLALAVGRLVLIYRRGAARTREQIRWLMLAGGGVVVLLVGGWVGQALGLSVDLAFAPFLVAIVVLVPLAVGIAVVRYDLYDVDRLLGTSAAWVLTLVLSAGVYSVVVLAVGQTVHDLTPLGSSVAAFVTALLLLPLHRWVTKGVGRFVDRDRHVAVAAMERFTADVRAGRCEPEQVEQALRDAQRDPDLRVLLAAADGTWVGLDGGPAVAEDGFTLEAGGAEIARVVLGWSSARARRRIADLTRVAWVPIEVSRLRLELRVALAQVRRSRARLAETAAAERRRLERDLHDGAQQHLLAIGMRLRLLQRELAGTQAAEIDAAVHDLRGTVDELRRLAQGVRPSRLDDGLAAALAAVRATSPLPFTLVVDELPVLAETRALTAYLVVSEAVSNVLKHARASRIDVRVSPCDGRIVVEVRDDGVGGVPGDEPLSALRDRVLSVGGTLRVDSPPGAGTTIVAVI